MSLIAITSRVSIFHPGQGRFPVGGAFCPQLDSLTPGQLPISFSQDLNFKGLDTHWRKGPWPDRSWNSEQCKVERGEGQPSPSVFRIGLGPSSAVPEQTSRQRPHAGSQVRVALPSCVHPPQSQALGSSSGALSRGGPPPWHLVGRTPTGASLGKSSAKLGTGLQLGRHTRRGGPIPGAGAGTWNGLHPDQGPGVRPGGRPGNPGAGGEPSRGPEQTRFSKTRFLLSYLRPSVTSQGPSPGRCRRGSAP